MVSAQPDETRWLSDGEQQSWRAYLRGSRFLEAPTATSRPTGSSSPSTRSSPCSARATAAACECPSWPISSSSRAAG